MVRSSVGSRWGLSGSLIAVVACQEDSKDLQDSATAVECDMSLPTSCPDDAPRYAQVQPIFDEYCSGCHGKDWTGAWPLDTYSHVADWADIIQGELLRCSMPPADAGVAFPAEKRRMLMTWIGCGARN